MIFVWNIIKRRGENLALLRLALNSVWWDQSHLESRVSPYMLQKFPTLVAGNIGGSWPCSQASPACSLLLALSLLSGGSHITRQALRAVQLRLAGTPLQLSMLTPLQAALSCLLLCLQILASLVSLNPNSQQFLLNLAGPLGCVWAPTCTCAVAWKRSRQLAGQSQGSSPLCPFSQGSLSPAVCSPVSENWCFT